MRRLDERSSYLYVLHGENHLTVLDLDTREHVGGASAAAYFDYGMGSTGCWTRPGNSPC